MSVENEESGGKCRERAEDGISSSFKCIVGSPMWRVA